MHLLDCDSSPIQSPLYPSRYVHKPKDTDKYEHFIEHLVYIVVRDKECVKSSPRVSGVCQDDTREFVRRRPRLIGRLSGVAEKLAESYDSLVMDV
ncbi:hypothetical protein GW17_00048009 [Ensete ventricosum]|nr:hypothetical protein GW17_00048009 [Ensete ventricosum]RZS27551.1 hypothetical protein BHM03_00061046 [Ensete ventricosum]